MIDGQYLNPQLLITKDTIQPDLDPVFVKASVESSLNQIGYTKNYTYDILNYKFSNNTVEIYAEIKAENSDSNDYLTIECIKAQNDWKISDFYLEK